MFELRAPFKSFFEIFKFILKLEWENLYRFKTANGTGKAKMSKIFVKPVT